MKKGSFKRREKGRNGFLGRKRMGKTKDVKPGRALKKEGIKKEDL